MMKKQLSRLALLASVFFALALFLSGCGELSHPLKIDCGETTLEFDVRIGDVLPAIKTPEKIGFSFAGFKQNGKSVDLEQPLASVAPVTADFVENTEASEGLKYKITDTGLAVTGIESANLSVDRLIVPASAEVIKEDGETEKTAVVAVGDGAFQNLAIGALVLPDTVTKIGEKAFENTKTSHIYLPNGVVEIGSRAFFGASGFRFFDVPDKTERIAPDAIATMKIEAFRTHTNRYDAGNGVLFFGKTLFSYPAGAAARDYTVPDRVTEIGSYAFYGQTFGRLFLGTSTVKIADHAVENARISELDLGRTEILGEASLRNLSTTVLTIPESVAACGALSLDGISAKRVVFCGNPEMTSPGTVGAVIYAEDAGVDAVADKLARDVVFPASVLSDASIAVRDGVVYDCPPGVRSVVIEPSVIEIAPFSLNAEGLSEIEFQCAPPMIGAGAFYLSPDLKLTVPEGQLERYVAEFPGYAAYFELKPPEVRTVRVTFSVDHAEETIEVEEGAELILPTVWAEHRIFTGWTTEKRSYLPGERVTILTDTVFVATFCAESYIVSFYAEGVLLKRESVPYLGAARAPDAPVKAETAEFRYEFAGWDRAFDAVTEDMTIVAEYVETRRSYAVRFYADGKLIEEISVLYGAAARAPDAPVKAETAEFRYEFAGWDRAFDAVTEEITVNAVFDETPRFYNVRCLVNGVPTFEKSVRYGEAVGALPSELNGRTVERYVDRAGNPVDPTTAIRFDLTIEPVFKTEDDPYFYTNGLEFVFDADLNGYSVEYYTGQASEVTVPRRVCGAEGDFNVVRIGSAVFQDRFLRSVALPDTILEIADLAFYGVTGLDALTLPRELRRIGANAFAETEMRLTLLTDNLTDIDEWQDTPIVIFVPERYFDRYTSIFEGRGESVQIRKAENETAR